MGGLNYFSGEELPNDSPVVPMTAAQAIHILQMTKHKTRGIGKAPGKRPSPEERAGLSREDGVLIDVALAMGARRGAR